MMKNQIVRSLSLGVAVTTAAFGAKASDAPPKHKLPNFVFVLCDDLGYGDVQCLNPKHGKIATPNADKLVSQGVVFTNAHSGSSVCTPTRYGLLTGRYSWRTQLQHGVVQGYAPCLIDEARPTVASFLKDQGYHTAIIGKWHLNFQYLDPKTGQFLKSSKKKSALPPVGTKIPDGPLTRGFDYYHGFHHAKDMKAVIENDTVIQHDDVINMLPRLTSKAVDYIDQRAKHRDQPFFLYVPLNAPHTPIMPSPEWRGKSGLGDYGDFVMQTDASIGAIMKALKRNNLSDNTVVILSSDNGCSKAAGISNLREKGHWVSAQYRGSKADIWDGGHRVPFVVRWPGKIKPGSTTEQLICLTDFFATVSDIAGKPIHQPYAEDSVSFLPALLGKSIKSSRNGVVHHSISGHFAYRQGDWKLLLARGSGGWTKPREKESKEAPEAQLYNMHDDPSETKSLYKNKPEIAQNLLKELKNDISRGRSTDGAESKNDTNNIKLWKSGRDKDGR